MVRIKIPAAARKRYGLPQGDLIVVSSWAVGESGQSGLWIARAEEPAMGRRWPVVVDTDKARKWLDDAKVNA